MRLDPKVQAAIDAYDLDLDILDGDHIDEPVSHVDLLPTLTAVAGTSDPAGVAIDGKNILPLAAGEASSVERANDALYWSSGFYKVVRAGDWKLQLNERQDRRWLFNLAEDPGEAVNLAETEPEKLGELEALIEAHGADARPPLYPHQSESPICIDKTLLDRPCDPGNYVIWPN